jgi:Uma2 family endonuclease
LPEAPVAEFGAMFGFVVDYVQIVPFGLFGDECHVLRFIQGSQELAHNMGMPVAVDILESTSAPPHKLWTRAECEVMERAGVLDLERYELIGGELILKMGKKGPRMRAVMRLVRWLRSVHGETFVAQEPSISVSPVDSPTSEPEPDAIVVNRSFLDIDGLAGPDELLLVAEVSGATLSFDLTVKAGLYARAGIAEYWILDIQRLRLIVHRRPEGGRYLDVVGYLEEESVAPLAAPAAMVRVGDLF